MNWTDEHNKLFLNNQAIAVFLIWCTKAKKNKKQSASPVYGVWVKKITNGQLFMVKACVVG